MLQPSVGARIARMGAMHGYKPSEDIPKPTAGQPAATVGHAIKHASFWAKLAGVVAGAIIAAAVIAVTTALIGGPAVLVLGIAAVGCMGVACAASAMGAPGVARATAKVGAAVGDGLMLGMGGMITKASHAVTDFFEEMGSTDGVIATGATGVVIEGALAARAGVTLKEPDAPVPAAGDSLAEGVSASFSPAADDVVACTQHPSAPPPKIAQGSDTVFINGQPAARKGDKTECGATIRQGAKTVFIGVEGATYLNVASEFAWWQKAIFIAVEFLIPPSRGMMKGFGKLFTRTGRQALTRGARAGALKAVTNVRRNIGCAYHAFKNKTGFKRYAESVKKFFAGDPIDVVTGSVMEQRTDFELGQTLPLRLTRTFVADYSGTGIVARNQADSFSECLLMNETQDLIEARLADGQSLYFSLPAGFDEACNPEHPDFTLARNGAGYALTDRRDRISRLFTRSSTDPSVWLLASHSDPHGNAITFYRDKQQRLTRVEHSDGIILVFSWQGNGYLERIIRTDAGLNDTLVRYRHTPEGWLAEVDSLSGYHLFYDYTARGLLARWDDHDKTWTRYEYDSAGRCIFSEGAEGYYTVTLSYVPGCTKVTDGKGHSRRYYHDDRQRVTAVEQPDGSTTRYHYDEYGHLLSQVSPQGRTIAFEYLADTGLVSRYINEQGACWQYTWTENQRLMSVQDPLGRVWLQQYDEKGEPVHFTAPDGTSTTLSYNAAGLVTTVENSIGTRQLLSYDAQHQLLSLFSEARGAIQFRYDKRGRVRTLLQNGKSERGFHYDARGRLIKNTRPDGSHEAFVYDRHGNLTTWTDANGVDWTLEYGAFDLPVARTDGEGHRWQYCYDKDTLALREVINPQGESYQYETDAAGRVVTERDYAGTQWHYRYDEDGNCIERRDALGQVTTREYDACCRLITTRSPEEITRYRYDCTGRLLSVRSGEEEESFTWDGSDRPVREVSRSGETEYEYPDAHTVIRHLRHGDDAPALTTVFRYHPGGGLAEVVLPDGPPLRFTRGQDGHERERASPAGFVYSQEHDESGMLVRQRAGYNARLFSGAEMRDIPVPTLAALDRHYGYDAAQNLVSVNDDAERLSYVVNGNHQVVSVSSGRTLRESYRYDACGYPAQGDSGTGQAVGHDDIYRRGHRLNRLGRHGYEYDAAGRMTARRLERDGYRPEYTRFVWNTQNQLVALQDGQGRKWTYRYDSRGRRTEKRCEAAGLRTAYLWDGDTVAEIREYRDESLQRVRHQVFQGYELTVLQEWRRERPAWRTYFAVSAPAGQPLALFDTGGKCVWRRPRESLWGEVPGKAIQNAELDPGLKFAGQQWDEESGLCYNRYRYYCAESKCYLTPDPIGLAGGENPYAYVHNPLGWIDPLGLAACPGMYDWYKYNRSLGMTATQAHQAIKNASPQDVFNYALHRQGMSGSNYPINFKEKFTAGNYKYEVRAHDVNPNAPSGSNSVNGPIYRVGRSQSGVNPVTNQGYGWEYGSPSGSWHHTSVLKPNSPNYNPGAANDTHIPLPTGIIP